LYRIYSLGNQFILVGSEQLNAYRNISQIDPLGKIWSVKKLFDVMEYIYMIISPMRLRFWNISLGKNKFNEKFIYVRIYLKKIQYKRSNCHNIRYRRNIPEL
jgi:hypothetical protein